MNVLVVDASVWVAAADSGDRFWDSSRGFLMAVARSNIPVAVPAFAVLEVACALARRLQDAQMGRTLSANILRSLASEVHNIETPILNAAVAVGTECFLRAGDALYAALADRLSGQLISWDNELVRRAHAVTPEAWLAEQT